MTHVTLYQHAKRPEWGLAVAIGHVADRRVFLFESGERRAIMNEYAHLMSEVEPAEEVAAEARKRFDKHVARATTPAGVRKKTRPRKASASPDKAKSNGAASKTEPAAE